MTVHMATNLVTCYCVATAGRNGYVWDDTQGSSITPDVNFWDLLLFTIEGEPEIKTKVLRVHEHILMYLYFIYMAVRYSMGSITSRSSWFYVTFTVRCQRKVLTPQPGRGEGEVSRQRRYTGEL